MTLHHADLQHVFVSAVCVCAVCVYAFTCLHLLAGVGEENVGNSYAHTRTDTGHHHQQHHHVHQR